MKEATKSNAKPQAQSVAGQKASKDNSAAIAKKQPQKQKITKQDQVIAMLRQSKGTTIAAVMKATGWQKHSVHGFLAGVVRNKLGLSLVSETADGERTYRIPEDKRPRSSVARRSGQPDVV